jgi:hypothetical protein
MKYFMSVFDPNKAPIYPYKLIFWMDRVTADYFYHKYLEGEHSDYIEKCFLEGRKFIRDSGEVTIWGENISDKALFKRKLRGQIMKKKMPIRI